MDSTNHPLIGAHCSVTGGLATGGLRYAADVGAEVMQVFVSNPRGWALAAGKPEEDARIRDAGTPVYIHATYLINLGSPTPETLEKSIDSLRHALQRGAAIGARGVVVHTGSAVSQSREDALRQVREALLPLLEEIPEGGPDLLLESMAGQGRMLCATVEDHASYLAALDHHPKIGICLDTCHIFAAGHDLTASGGVAKTLEDLHEIAPDRLKLIHANDSKDPCGAKKDRHENIGEGTIGAEPFWELLAHPLTSGVPLTIETPGKVEQHRKDVELLKSLREG